MEGPEDEGWALAKRGLRDTYYKMLKDKRFEKDKSAIAKSLVKLGIKSGIIQEALGLKRKGKKRTNKGKVDKST
eukprot:UN21518